MSVTSNNSVEEMLNKYKTVLQGLRCFKEPYHIKIDTSVIPIIHIPRRIPTTLMIRGKLKATLDEMETLGVLRKIDELTFWVSSMIVVEKPKSNKRVCLESKALNCTIMRERIELVTVGEIMPRMTEAKVF